MRKISSIWAPFRAPTAATLAAIELQDAKRQLLIAETGADYAASMVAYRKAQVLRLTNYIRQDAQAV